MHFELRQCTWQVKCIRLKKIISLSQSLRQIGKPDLNAVFLTFFFFFVFCFFVFFFLSSSRFKFEPATTLFSMKYGILFLDKEDTKQNKELKKYLVQSVLLCLSCLFFYILTSKFIKDWEKKLSKQKKLKAWILPNQSRIEKQTRAPALRHTIYFFSLS